MRICRYFWLLVGLIIPHVTFAQAYETIPAIQVWMSESYTDIKHPDPEEVCRIYTTRTIQGAVFTHITDRGEGLKRCHYSWQGWFPSTNIMIQPGCPDASWTYKPASNTCERLKTCPSGQREWNGECRPECDAMQTVNSETGNCECSSMRKPIPSPSVSGPGATPETTCYGGCSYKLGDMALNLGGKEWFSDLGQPTGQTCSAGQGESEKPLPETKEPPCAPGEGVATSSSGKVLCVPEGTPNAPKPDVQKTVKKETYPDGSEKTTETTKTKDPTTGATDTKSTSTSTGGMAGPAGTTTTTETSTGDGKEPGQGDGDGDGDCEGDDCGGGEGFKGPEGDLYEKKDRTMRDALEDFSAAVSDSPVMVAARNWFSIGGMPASCGGLSVTVPYLDTTISADTIFCGEYGVLIMQIAGAVVLAAAAYAGFRIAIL